MKPGPFRFWGNIDPHGRTKPPILAMAPGGAVDENGVATIRIYDPIDSYGDWWGVSAREFLETLDQVGDATSIRLHLNSPGGEVWEAIAILNALRAHPAPVTAVVDGLAASAASFIAAGVDELVMGQNTELMIHDAWGIAIGPAAAMRDVADRLDHISDNIASIYSSKAGTPVDDWRAAMLAETWYSADEAVAVGLADSVAAAAGDEASSEAIAAAASFDLSVFRAAGRRQAEPPIVPSARKPHRPAAQPAADERAVRFQQRKHQAAAARHGLTV